MGSTRFSNVEFVSPLSSPFSQYFPSYGGRTMLSSLDRVLVENGGSGHRALDIYLQLLTNPVVYKSWDKLMAEICARELLVEPLDAENREAVRVADFVREQLRTIGDGASTLLPSNGGIDGLTRACGLAYITGIAAVELVWGRNSAGERVVQYYKARDSRLFRMAYDSASRTTVPRVLHKDDMVYGKQMPDGKFVLHRHWAVPSDDDYGCGLGRNLYYPVEWQKQLMSYWLMLIDKTVMPSTVGTVAQEARVTEEQLSDFKSALRNFGQDSSVFLPPGFSIDTVQMSASNADTLSSLLDKIDVYIETLILGESAAGKQGGTFDSSSSADSLRVTKAKALSDEISDTINATLVKWLVWANFGKSAPMPKVWRNFAADVATVPANLAEVEPISDFIDMLSKLDSINISLDRDYIQQRLGVPLRSNKQPAAPGAPGRTGTALYDNVPSPQELINGS